MYVWQAGLLLVCCCGALSWAQLEVEAMALPGLESSQAGLAGSDKFLQMWS